MHPCVLSNTVYNSQDMETTQMSIDGWMGTEYYSAIKKEWNTICSNMDGPRDDQTKWSESDRERQISYNITYMWNLKYDTNELI